MATMDTKEASREYLLALFDSPALLAGTPHIMIERHISPVVELDVEFIDKLLDSLVDNELVKPVVGGRGWYRAGGNVSQMFVLPTVLYSFDDADLPAIIEVLNECED